MSTFTSASFQCLLSENNFLFGPDASDSTDLADRGIDVFTTPWDKTRNLDAYELLITCFNDGSVRFGGITLNYTGDEFRVTDSTSTVKIIETDYTLTISSILVASGVQDSVALGGALRWEVQDEGDSWRITRWDDFRKGALTTWGNYMGGAEGGVDFCPEAEENSRKTREN